MTDADKFQRRVLSSSLKTFALSFIQLGGVFQPLTRR